MNIQELKKSIEADIEILKADMQKVADENWIRMSDRKQAKMQALQGVIDRINLARGEQSSILNDLLNEKEEVLMSPLRFEGVSVQKIKNVFEKHGITEETKF